MAVEISITRWFTGNPPFTSWGSILFIRSDNPASLQAHAKMGMTIMAMFDLNGRKHVVLSYWG